MSPLYDPDKDPVQMMLLREQRETLRLLSPESRRRAIKELNELWEERQKKKIKEDEERREREREMRFQNRDYPI